MTQVAVTVLAGFAPAATHAVARCLLAADPSLALVSHDLTGLHDGVVRRTIRTLDLVLEETATELVHGCVSCTLREDVVPTLVRLARERPGSGILLALPPAIEPEAVAAACRTVTELRFDSYVTVVEAATILDTLTSSDDLRHRDLHAAGNDNRSVADVVCRQLEFADTVVVWGDSGQHELERDRITALLHRLVPWADQVRIADTTLVDCTALGARVLRTGRHDPSVPGMAGRALAGYPIGIDDPIGDFDVTSVLFHSRRPFHAQRLHDALDDLTSETLRGRGQLWLASQPATAISWESAGGGIQLGNLGRWLAAVAQDRWAEASPMRLLAADATWDAYYGDRFTVLSFTGFGLDPDEMLATLTSCLLTDAELAEGMASWSHLPDPFHDFFPADDPAVSSAGRP